MAAALSHVTTLVPATRLEWAARSHRRCRPVRWTDFAGLLYTLVDPSISPMLRRIVDAIERFEEGDLSTPAFAGMAVLFTLGWITYAATWAVIGWLVYTGTRIAVGYPV